MKIRLVALLSFIISIFSANAQIQLSDSAEISLLTCDPWPGAVYALYGHTALRVQDDSTHLDTVFNYGLFDQSKPNFMYHFVRGETDYILGTTSFEMFISEYIFKKVAVYEQALNLNQAEKQQLWQALYINQLPENRGYRYNYFYDNCATRPRDMVEKFAGGKIVYPPTEEGQTYRDLLHECLNSYSWDKFGVDLIIGAKADKPIDVRAKMFLPAYLMKSFEGATVVKNDTTSYPLVKQTKILFESDNKVDNKSEHTIFSPIIIAFALLLLTLIVSGLQIVKMNKTLLPKIYDTVLFSIAGIGGVIIFFLMYFSEHPATNPNWNFVWLNVFALIFAGIFWVKSARNLVYFYHFINFAALTLFLLFWWFIPQQLPLATIPFSMSLWIRSGTNVFMSRKRRQTNKRYASLKYMKAGWGQ